jgi:hypothetical protein
MPDGLPGAVRRIASSGIRAGVSPEVRRRLSLINAFSLVIIAFSMVMILVNLFFGEHLFVLLVLGLSLVAGAAILLNHITGSPRLSSTLLALATNSFAVYLLYSGGVSGNGHLWIFFLPTLAMFAFGVRTGLLSMGGLLLACALILIWPDDALLGYTYSFGFRLRFLLSLGGLTVFSAVAEQSRKLAQRRLDQRNRELEEALREVRELSGLIPICSSCKKIRDDEGYWSEVEVYMRQHSELDFSHSLCPECSARLYPDHAGESGGGED